MRNLATAFIVGLAVAFASQDALAGQITASSGPIKVNDKPATLPVVLNKGDLIDTGSATATCKSDAGDVVSLEMRTVAISEGAEGGVEYFFVKSGAATGDLSEKTTLGVAIAWATPAKGQRAVVRVEAPVNRPAREGRFRTMKGDGVWLYNRAYSTWLPREHVVTLWTEQSRPGMLGFRTGQQNGGEVEINKHVLGGNIRVLVARATYGEIDEAADDRSRISNEIGSNRHEKLRVESEFGWTSVVDLSPGTYMIVDHRARAGGGVARRRADDFEPDRQLVPELDASERSPRTIDPRYVPPRPVTSANGKPTPPPPPPSPPAAQSPAVEEPVPPPKCKSER